MKVIGIDPAPSKESTVCNEGKLEEPMGFTKLQGFLGRLKAEPTLICWDAPISGPHISGGDLLATRLIENFFMQTKNLKLSKDGKLPPGISIRSYSQCPHWTISRAVLGLPKVGDYDCSPSYDFCTEFQSLKDKTNVVEVHPAIAIWLWCKDSEYAPTSWEYKKNSEIRNKLWGEILKDKLDDLLKEKFPKKVANDDQLDALVAYALGRLWLDGDGQGKVVFLGDEDSGGFLVPNDYDTSSEWRKFRDSRSKKKQPITP